MCLAVLFGGGGGQHSPLKRSVSLTPPMSDGSLAGSSSLGLGHGWLSQEDLRGPRGGGLGLAPTDPHHAPLSPQSSVASSGSGGSEHLEDAGLGGGGCCGGGLYRSSTFHKEGSGMRGEFSTPPLSCVADRVTWRRQPWGLGGWRVFTSGCPSSIVCFEVTASAPQMHLIVRFLV